MYFYSTEICLEILNRYKMYEEKLHEKISIVEKYDKKFRK